MSKQSTNGRQLVTVFQYSLHATLFCASELQIPFFSIMLTFEPLLREIIMCPNQTPDKVILGQWQLVAPLATVGKDLGREQRIGALWLADILRLTLALNLARCLHQSIEKCNDFGPGHVGEEMRYVLICGESGQEGKHDVDVRKYILVTNAS
jgi:hypothetical protein